MEKVEDIRTDEVENAKNEFSCLRPEVPKDLVLKLWRYWSQHCPNRLFFEVPPEDPLFESNIALLLHAQAYGENVPLPGDNGFLSNLLREHQEKFTPIIMAPPAAGIKFILSNLPVATFNLPILRVWIYMNDTNEPVRIVAVGQGIKEIRGELLERFLETSLMVYGTNEDFLNSGIIHIEMPGHGAGMITGELAHDDIVGHTESLTEHYENIARQGMRELRKYLKRMEQKTGLVEIQELHTKYFDRIVDTYQELLTMSLEKQKSVIWQPKDSGCDNPACAFVPLYDLSGGAVLGITLHDDLMWTTEYMRLFEEFKKSSIDRTIADLRVRELSYKRWYRRLWREKEDYETASPDERNLRWTSTVELNYMFINETGTWKKLSKPEKKATESWFQDDVPAVLKRIEQWFYRFRNSRMALVKSVCREDSPLRRLAISHFFDFALRNMTLEGSPELVGAYEEWSQRFQPMLWFEFRSFLRKNRVDHKAFGSNTFFHTMVRSVSQNTPSVEIGFRLHVNAYSILFENGSLVVFDTLRGATKLYDSAQLGTIDYGQSESSEQLWTKLKDSILNSEITKEDFAVLVQQAISQQPSDIISKILQYLLTAPQVEEEIICQTEREIRKQLVVSRNYNLAIRAAVYNAYHTAREALAEYNNYPDISRTDKAKMEILKSIIECSAKNLPVKDEVVRTFRYQYSSNQDVGDAVASAIEADENYTTEWIQLLEKQDILAALMRLVRGQKAMQELLDKKSYAVYLAILSALYAKIGRAFKEAALELSQSKENREDVLINLGNIFEEAILNPLSDCPIEEVTELFSILTGEEKIIQ